MRALWSSRVVFAPVLLAVILIHAKGSYALSTAFTFRGQLRLNDAPASGTCDLEFRLFDALNGGGQIGTTQAVSGVEVNEGRFTVQLDFGPSAFAGDDRRLDIAVRCPAGAGYVLTFAIAETYRHPHP